MPIKNAIMRENISIVVSGNASVGCISNRAVILIFCTQGMENDSKIFQIKSKLASKVSTKKETIIVARNRTIMLGCWARVRSTAPYVLRNSIGRVWIACRVFILLI